MGFSEPIKLKAKRKAHFRCCMCEGIVPLDVHHITPESQGGPDTLDNAVALCPTCHASYGGEHRDSRTRKWIKQKRDWWHEHCEKESVDTQKLEEAHNIIMDEASGIRAKIEHLESMLWELALQNNQIQSDIRSAPWNDKLKLMDNFSSTSGTITIVSNAVTGLSTASGYFSGIRCPKCNTRIVSDHPEKQEPLICPTCGERWN